MVFFRLSNSAMEKHELREIFKITDKKINYLSDASIKRL